MSFSNKRFILWDHDGVLVDTERWYYAALREAMLPLGVDFDQASYLDCMADGRTYWDLAAARGERPRSKSPVNAKCVINSIVNSSSANRSKFPACAKPWRN